MDLSESSNRRRSQRLALQVVVLLRITMADGSCLQGQAFTSVVNAHGGLLEFPVRLENNQKIQINNPHSGEEVSCRVLRVEGTRAALYEVAFEFEKRSPLFWQIDFPPENWVAKEEEATK